MAEDLRAHAFPLLNGIYKMTNSSYFLRVNGGHGIFENGVDTKMEVGIEMGEFGEAEPEIVEKATTGDSVTNKNYNIQISYPIMDNFKELGIVSDDGMRITSKNIMGINNWEWITEEELAAIQAEGDPIEAPPGFKS